MSKMSFSKGKFSKFLSSKGFYLAIAVCLVGAGVATWLAVDRTITGIERSNNQILQSEPLFNDFPQVEEAEKKVDDILREESTPSPPSLQESSQLELPSELQETQLEQPEQSEQPAASPASPKLAYSLPIRGDIINQFSGGELVKNVTLDDWRTHDGVDIAADKGADVYAAADGIVTGIVDDPLWGTVVTIDHVDGNQTIYCGLDSVLPVKVGEQVLVKQAIGKVDGVPCEISEANHMHFAMKKDGLWVDPLSMIARS